MVKSIRRHENTGRPLGDKRFILSLEKLLHRKLKPGKPGPEPKNKEN